MGANTVSIIVPVYNAERYLARCLQSIARQTWKDIEAIIVDDGSNDGSLGLTRQYASSDSRIHVFAQPNQGASAARNKGLEIASGAYLLFVDADDYMEDDAVEKMMEYAKDKPSVMVLCNNDEVWEHRCDTRVLFDHNRNTALGKSEVMSAIAVGRAGLVCGKLISSDMIRAHLIRFDESITMCEDQVFFLKVASVASHFFYVNSSLYVYDRRNENSATLRYQPDAFQMQLRVQNCLRELLLHDESALKETREVLLHRFQSMLRFCIHNELIGLTVRNTPARVRNLDQISSYPEAAFMLDTIRARSMEDKVMVWAIKRKKGIWVLLLQLLKKYACALVQRIVRQERRGLNKHV